MNKLFGQMKILLSMLQIFSSAPSVITGVEFPPFFRKVSNIFGNIKGLADSDSLRGAATDTYCIACESGTYLNEVGKIAASDCDLCGIGKYLPYTGADTKLTRTRSVRLKKLKRMNKLFGQMKILLSMLQIFSSAPSVITGVEFPPFFRKVSNVFAVFNLDLLSFSGILNCGMSVRFFDQFLIHMMLPLGCCLAIVAVFVLTHACTSKTNTVKHTEINEAVSKVLILVILLLFPGLSTKIFQVGRS